MRFDVSHGLRNGTGLRTAVDGFACGEGVPLINSPGLRGILGEISMT